MSFSAIKVWSSRCDYFEGKGRLLRCSRISHFFTRKRRKQSLLEMMLLVVLMGLVRRVLCWGEGLLRRLYLFPTCSITNIHLSYFNSSYWLVIDKTSAPIRALKWNFRTFCEIMTTNRQTDRPVYRQVSLPISSLRAKEVINIKCNST